MSSFLEPAERVALMGELRQRARPDYLQALLLPDHVRDTFIVLRSFHAELLDIVRKAKEAPLAEIRLQWWADGVLLLRDAEVRSNPIGRGLLRYLELRPNARTPLAAKAEAHSTDLYPDAPRDRTAFEEFAGSTRSILVQLAASEFGHPERWTLASGHAGVAELVAARISQLPQYFSKGSVPIPLDLLSDAGTDPERWLRVADEQNETVHRFAKYGLEHLEKARAALRIDGESGPFGHLTLTEDVLRKARAAPDRAVKEGVKIGPLRTQWLLWRG